VGWQTALVDLLSKFLVTHPEEGLTMSNQFMPRPTIPDIPHPSIIGAVERLLKDPLNSLVTPYRPEKLHFSEYYPNIPPTSTPHTPSERASSPPKTELPPKKYNWLPTENPYDEVVYQKPDKYEPMVFAD